MHAGITAITELAVKNGLTKSVAFECPDSAPSLLFWVFPSSDSFHARARDTESAADRRFSTYFLISYKL